MGQDHCSPPLFLLHSRSICSKDITMLYDREYTKVTVSGIDRSFDFPTRIKVASLEEIRYDFSRRATKDERENPNYWPCPYCEGNGKIRDPDYDPDPIEGYKMAGHVKCQRCSGTGKSDKKTLQDLRKEYNQTSKNEIAKSKKEIEKLKEILGKLNEEDRKYLSTIFRAWFYCSNSYHKIYKKYSL
jgi:hypothetical protein